MARSIDDSGTEAAFRMSSTSAGTLMAAPTLQAWVSAVEDSSQPYRTPTNAMWKHFVDVRDGGSFSFQFFIIPRSNSTFFPTLSFSIKKQ